MSSLRNVVLTCISQSKGANELCKWYLWWFVIILSSSAHSSGAAGRAGTQPRCGIICQWALTLGTRSSWTPAGGRGSSGEQEAGTAPGTAMELLSSAPSAWLQGAGEEPELCAASETDGAGAELGTGGICQKWDWECK